MGAGGKLPLFGGVMQYFNSTNSPNYNAPDPLWKPLNNGPATSNQFPSNWWRDAFMLSGAFYGGSYQGLTTAQMLSLAHNYCASNGINGPTVQIYYPGKTGPGFMSNQANAITYLQALAPNCPAGTYQIVANEVFDGAGGMHIGDLLNSMGGTGTTGIDGFINWIKLCRQYLPGALLGVNDLNMVTYDNNPSSSTFNFQSAINIYAKCAQNGAALDWLGDEGYTMNWQNRVAQVNTNINNLCSQLVTTKGTGATNVLAFTEWTPNLFGGGGAASPQFSTQLAVWQNYLPMFAANQYVFGVTGPWEGFRRSNEFNDSDWLYDDTTRGGSDNDNVPTSQGHITATLVYVQGWVPQNVPNAVGPPPTGPFGASAPNLPGTIVCSAYDYGGQNIGYNFLTNGGQNAAAGYRTDGVQNLKANTDTFSSNPWVVGYGTGGTSDATDNWTAYTCNFLVTGLYSFVLRCGTATGGAFHLSIDGNDTAGVTIPAQGAWDTPGEWVSIYVPGTYSVSAGTHLVKILIDQSNLDINDLTVVFGGSPRVLYADFQANSGGTTLSVTNVLGETAGNQLLACISTFSSTAGAQPVILSVADTVNGGYSPRVGPVYSSNCAAWIYSYNGCAFAGRSGNTVTVTFTAPVVGSIQMVLVEISGQAGGANTDVTNTATGTGAGASVSVTTTNPTDGILVWGQSAGQFDSPGSGFNNILINPPQGVILDFKQVQTTGTYTDAPANTTFPLNWTLVALAIKAGGAQINLGGNSLVAIKAQGTLTVTRTPTSFSGTAQPKVVASGSPTVTRLLAGRTN